MVNTFHLKNLKIIGTIYGVRKKIEKKNPEKKEEEEKYLEELKNKI
jgi:hypothetical protein